MKVRHHMSMEAYPEPAIKLMLDTAVGKPFRDNNGEVIGKIIEVSRTDENPKVLEFISELFEGVNPFESESESMVSFDTTRKD
jgi:hypothetical protein